MSVSDAAFDVVVVGCGPVGALCALLLGSYGLRVCVLERESSRTFPAPRAVAVLKAHLFKLLFLALEANRDLRDRLGAVMSAEGVKEGEKCDEEGATHARREVTLDRESFFQLMVGQQMIELSSAGKEGGKELMPAFESLDTDSDGTISR
jgi:2-polyprenyl-6-methoxyphenol hydroxylase-like FAD-dependent oxidoreductase